MKWGQNFFPGISSDSTIHWRIQGRGNTRGTPLDSRSVQFVSFSCIFRQTFYQIIYWPSRLTSGVGTPPPLLGYPGSAIAIPSLTILKYLFSITSKLMQKTGEAIPYSTPKVSRLDVLMILISWYILQFRTGNRCSDRSAGNWDDPIR